MSDQIELQHAIYVGILSQYSPLTMKGCYDVGHWEHPHDLQQHLRNAVSVLFGSPFLYYNFYLFRIQPQNLKQIKEPCPSCQYNHHSLLGWLDVWQNLRCTYSPTDLSWVIPHPSKSHAKLSGTSLEIRFVKFTARIPQKWIRNT